MPDLLELLRMKNIFGVPPIKPGLAPLQLPVFGGGPDVPPMIDFGKGAPPIGVSDEIPGATGASPSMDIAERLSKLYTPETAATERFNKLIEEYPRMENYKPGWLRTIAAALSAFGPGGHDMGMKIALMPYQQKLADWKAMIEPAYQAANLERLANINERSMAYQTISAQLRAEADEERARNNQRNAEIRQQRANVYEWKARNPQGKLIFPKGGFVQMVDPVTGQVTTLKDSEGQPIPTGVLTDTDRIELEKEAELAVVGERGAQARQTERLRQAGEASAVESRGWKIYNVPDPQNPSQMKAVKINEITGEVKDIQTGPVSKPTGTGSQQAEVPGQTKIRLYNKAIELKMTDPELGKFIVIGPGTNEWSIQEGFRGPSPEQRKRITDFIYGVSPAASHSPTTPTPGTRIKVRQKATGKIGTIPAEQLEQALAQGYELVK